ncbi:MAG: MOSC domain-containing protein [Haloarculaceae archaeon]
MSTGRVVSIHTAPDAEAPTESRDSVEAVARRGLRGDRYFEETGTFSHVEGTGRHLTLVEAESLAAVERDYGFDLEPGEHRRNVTTEGVALNHLVGERFRVGEAVCVGQRLCEPCQHLASLVKEGVEEAFKHRGGLRADVVESGTIAAGDEVRRVE